MKIALGSAQFGMDYGINNKRGKIPKKEVFKILKKSKQYGIEIIDTSIAYGKSEKTIGEFEGRNKFKIITKGNVTDFEESLKNLKVEKIYGYLIHHFDDFRSNNKIWNELLKKKKNGKIKKIGFSLYYPKELIYLVKNDIIPDMVQVPYNIFDRRFEKFFEELKDRNVEIYIRSIFLQGLFFKKPEDLSDYFKSVKADISKIQRLGQENNFSISQLLMGYINSKNNADVLIIGVDGINNLIENLNFKNLNLSKRMLNELDKMKVNDENIIIPNKWPEKKTNNKFIKFGNAKTFILIGSGPTLMKLAKFLKNKKYEVYIFTCERQIGIKQDGISLKTFLKDNDVPFEMPEDIFKSRLARQLSKKNPMVISFGSPWIFKKDFLNLFKNPLINVHSRDLPRNKGGGGSSWLIMNGEKQSAVTIHVVDEGIDSGDIIKMEHFEFPEYCKTPKDYDNYTHEKEMKILKNLIRDIESGKKFNLTHQKHENGTYFPRLYTPIQGYINWNWDTKDIKKFIDAFDDPYSGASTYWKGQRIYMKKCDLASDNELFHPFMSGLIYRIWDKKIYIASKSGGVVVEELCYENGKSILNELKEGQRFYTPLSKLEEAKKYHPVYTPKGLK